MERRQVVTLTEEDRAEEERAGSQTHREAGVQPEGGAALVLHPLTQAGPRGTDVLVGPLPSEDPLIQAAGGQNVFLIEATERLAEGRAEQGGVREEDRKSPLHQHVS